jgi:hypothetical protein
VLAKDAAANTVTVGPAEALATRRVPVRAACCIRAGRPVDRVKLRYRSEAGGPARWRAWRPAGRHARLELELAEPVAGAAPGPGRLPAGRRRRRRLGLDQLLSLPQAERRRRSPRRRSRPSPIIRSTSASAKRSLRSPVLGELEPLRAGLRGPVASQTSKYWSDIP